MIKVGIAGATGYAGEELVRLLLHHPSVSITALASNSFAGKQLSEIYPSYYGKDYLLSSLSEDCFSDCDVVFLALPHGVSMNVLPALVQSGKKVIDLSGDFRYSDPSIYEAWYKIKHTQKELNQQAVYGLPELNKEAIKSANIIANPGCYTTASILALYPLLKNDLIKECGIVVDAKSGISGAGRKEALAYNFNETDESFKAYGVTTHRHTSEIEEVLSLASKKEIKLAFTPHLLPVKRGILATCYTELKEGVSPAMVSEAFETAYRDAAFTHVTPFLPELKQVTGSNNCFIGYQIDERLGRVIVISCIDNLIKGAAGQAIQNMNLLFGLEESAGLPKVSNYL